MPNLETELKNFFTKGAASIKNLNEFHETRDSLLNSIAKSWKIKESAIPLANAADALALKSLDDVTENHPVLIKLLTSETTAWAKLKSALADQDADAIKGWISLLTKLLDREQKLMPPTADAQAVFVKMTAAQMERVAAVR